MPSSLFFQNTNLTRQECEQDESNESIKSSRRETCGDPIKMHQKFGGLLDSTQPQKRVTKALIFSRDVDSEEDEPLDMDLNQNSLSNV